MNHLIRLGAVVALATATPSCTAPNASPAGQSENGSNDSQSGEADSDVHGGGIDDRYDEFEFDCDWPDDGEGDDSAGGGDDGSAGGDDGS